MFGITGNANWLDTCSNMGYYFITKCQSRQAKRKINPGTKEKVICKKHGRVLCGKNWGSMQVLKSVTFNKTKAMLKKYLFIFVFALFAIQLINAQQVIKLYEGKAPGSENWNWSEATIEKTS